MHLRRLGGIDLVTTDDGYLLEPVSWTPEVGEAIAEDEGVVLTPDHWAAVIACRERAFHHETIPTLAQIAGASHLSPEHLLELFPDRPELVIPKIAGLGRPTALSPTASKGE